MSAMLLHASGESGALYQDDYDGRFRGATAVVLEVKDEVQLIKTAKMLDKNSVRYVLVRESSLPYDGQYMAIGLVPAEREVVGPLLTEYQTLKKLEPLDDDTCSCTNCRLNLDKAEGGA
jgi:hypothetical protein